MALPNTDEFEGGATQVGGRIKEGAGRLTNNGALEREGVADQIKGKMQEGFGTAKHKLGDALEDASNNIQRTSDRLRD